MWYEILTVVNILGSVYAVICLLQVMHAYQVGPRMNFYLFLSIVALILIIMGQVYSFLTHSVRWVYKLPVMFYWLKTLYFCWMIRFTLLKKK